MFQLTKSKHLFEQAQKGIPGGVNSPVRAFKSVGGAPVFIQSAIIINNLIICKRLIYLM